MKKIFCIAAALVAVKVAFAQLQPADTNYNTRIVSVTWMPDGKAIFFSMVKFHKTDRKAPFFSKSFSYDLQSKKVSEVFENASSLAPSPDGKNIAFLKRDDKKKADIYLYNTETKQQTVLKTDTMSKNVLSWSPDGKKLLYNISYGGTGRLATIDVCVLDLATKKIKQVTQSGPHKSYSPAWNPDSKRIVYYLEKGDGRDQIWLTDAEGSFHSNLTNDTTTLNYFPSWIDEKTIIYTQDPETITTINADGTNKQKVEGIKAFEVKFSNAAGLLSYIPEEANKIMVFDWTKKTISVLLDEGTVKKLY